MLFSSKGYSLGMSLHLLLPILRRRPLLRESAEATLCVSTALLVAEAMGIASRAALRVTMRPHVLLGHIRSAWNDFRCPRPWGQHGLIDERLRADDLVGHLLSGSLIFYRSPRHAANAQYRLCVPSCRLRLPVNASGLEDTFVGSDQIFEAVFADAEEGSHAPFGRELAQVLVHDLLVQHLLAKLDQLLPHRLAFQSLESCPPIFADLVA